MGILKEQPRKGREATTVGQRLRERKGLADRVGGKGWRRGLGRLKEGSVGQRMGKDGKKGKRGGRKQGSYRKAQKGRWKGNVSDGKSSESLLICIERSRKKRGIRAKARLILILSSKAAWVRLTNQFTGACIVSTIGCIYEHTVCVHHVAMYCCCS